MADDKLRQQLTASLNEGHAHITFAKAVENFPLDRVGDRPAGIPHSAWELLEHTRIAQNDIVRFSRDGHDYVEMKWPDEYWPQSPAPLRAGDWEQSVRSFQQDLAEFVKMVMDPNRDLFEAFPWGDGQTLLRESLLIIDHNSYHLGQLLLVRRAVSRA